MIAFILEENRKLRAEIDEMNKRIQRKDYQIRVLEKKKEVE